ncbi:hypothetical protein KDN32_17715 [Nocardioides sp. J2M5]|uniref:hypothetical protein n=1 Tax=Nocardioides palaemonis TaxID=2829810 RepID=UPI001BA72278|nr:hypothetical protein [Nocardioides palaemonis]MBS2939580.1 hypothetical protein [Nocardioides palaemonis]
MAEPYDHPRFPGWFRVWLYAVDHEDQHLSGGQLREATGLDQRTLSRSLDRARRMSLLTPDSHARWLIPRRLSPDAALARGLGQVRDAS